MNIKTIHLICMLQINLTINMPLEDKTSSPAAEVIRGFRGVRA